MATNSSTVSLEGESPSQVSRGFAAAVWIPLSQRGWSPDCVLCKTTGDFSPPPRPGPVIVWPLTRCGSLLAVGLCSFSDGAEMWELWRGFRKMAIFTINDLVELCLSSGVFASPPNLVSSANLMSSPSTPSSRSLINILKSTGPSTEA
ncbi:CXXC motif containing zinc binding protein isoform X2 [Paroedura picta]|uniref:CXXC motif containing zinc binding protein isoform X2 n=1 Tax=Paroedura picta TaxID=143630 RepID=UPI0040570349